MRRPAAAVVLLAVLALLPLALGLRELQAVAQLKGKITVTTQTRNAWRVGAIEKSTGRAKWTALNSRGEFAFTKLPAGIYTVNLVKNGAFYGPVQCKALKICTTVNKEQVCSYSQVVMSFKNSGDMGTLAIGKAYASVPAANQKNVCFEGTGKMVARATNGVVVGAGKLGLVKKPAVAKKAAAPTAAAGVTPAAAPDPSRPGQDQDGDGIIGAMDVDDNGNMVVDNMDPTQAIPLSDATKAFYIFTNYKVQLNEQVNVYTGATLAQATARFKDKQTLAMAGMPKPGTFLASIVKDVRLNCLGLSYCKLGGTGVWMGDMSAGGQVPFPGDARFDYNETRGGGKMLPTASGDFQLKPNAGPSAVNAGDTFAITANLKNGSQFQFSGALNTVFYSTPAIAGYSWQGRPMSALPRNSPGTANNPIMLSNSAFDEPAGKPEGYFELSLWGYRPQRERYPGETFDPAVAGTQGDATYVDMGLLGWQVWAAVQPNGQPRPCNAGNFTVVPGSRDTKRKDTWMDTNPDLPAKHNSPKYTQQMKFTVLVHKCLGEANYYKGVTSPDGGGTNPCNPFTPQCDCSKLPDPKPIQCGGGGGGNACNPYTPQCDCSTLPNPKPTQCSVLCTPNYTPGCNCLATPAAQRPPECNGGGGGGGGGGGACNPYTPQCDCSALPDPKPWQCSKACTPTDASNCNCLITPADQRPPQCTQGRKRSLLSAEQPSSPQPHSARKLLQTNSVWKPGYTICFLVVARSQYSDNAETSICFKRPAA